jgi:hypothetical protein
MLERKLEREPQRCKRESLKEAEILVVRERDGLEEAVVLKNRRP